MISWWHIYNHTSHQTTTAIGQDSFAEPLIWTHIIHHRLPTFNIHMYLSLIFWVLFLVLFLSPPTFLCPNCLIVSVTGEAIPLVHHNATLWWVFLVFQKHILRFLSIQCPSKGWEITHAHHDLWWELGLGSWLTKL